MKYTAIATLLVTLSIATAACATTPVSAYVGQEKREIKALSADEVTDLLSGKGMGLARAAELNGYAGPAHVLGLSIPLALTAEQKAQTEALFASMERKALPLGQTLIEAERSLDQLFASKAITPDLLARSLDAIGALQAQLRGVHLEAHLVQINILTAEQSVRYAQLRGYGSQGAPQAHTSQHAH